MLRIRECKALARRTLLGRYGTVIAAYFITIAIKALMWILTAASGSATLYYAGVFGSMLGTGIAFSFPKLVGGVMLTMLLLTATVIVSLWFEIGSTRLMLNICRGLKSSVKDIFYGFRENEDAVCYILTGVVLVLIRFAFNAIQKLLYAAAGLVIANNLLHSVAVAVITAITLLAMWYVATAFMLAKIIIADKRESTIGGALSASRRLMKGRKLKGFWLLYFSFLFWHILTFFCAPAALWISPYIVCTTVIFYMDAEGTLWQLPGESGEASEAANDTSQADTIVNDDTAQAGTSVDDAAQTDASGNEEEAQADMPSGSDNNVQNDTAVNEAAAQGNISVNENAPQSNASANAEPQPGDISRTI